MARFPAFVLLLIAAGVLGATATPAQRLRGAAPNSTGKRPSLATLAGINATILSDIATRILPLIPNIALEAKEGLEPPPGWKAVADKLRQSWTQALPEITLFGQALADDDVSDWEEPLLQTPWQILSLASQATHQVLRGETSDLREVIAAKVLRVDPVLWQYFQSHPAHDNNTNNYTDLMGVLQEAFTEKTAELQNPSLTRASGFMPNPPECASLVGNIFSSYIDVEKNLVYASTDCSAPSEDDLAGECTLDVVDAMSSLAQALASAADSKFDCFNVDMSCMVHVARVVQGLWETARYEIRAQSDCSDWRAVDCVEDLLGAVHALAKASKSLANVRCEP